MKCPYCGRRVGDMPDHLKKVETCHDKHTAKLTVELREAVRAYIAPKEPDEKSGNRAGTSVKSPDLYLSPDHKVRTI